MKTPIARWAVVAVALSCGLAVGVAASAALTGDQPSISRVFEDGEVKFCPGGDQLSVGLATINPSAQGSVSPEAAVAAFLQWRRGGATGDQVAPELRDLFVRAMAPLAALDLPLMTAVSETLVYFDRPSAVQGYLDARVVVARHGDGYFVVEEYICSSALTDADAWAAYEVARDLGGSDADLP